MTDLRKMTKNFLLGERLDTPSLMSYIQSLEEIVYALKPSSKSEHRRIEIAKEHVRNVKRHSKRLMEKVTTLEERLSTLEENQEE
tara:strand:- start:252 stop:506 length:255 start_codon:yes stop_codon:yes gene_type:complete